MCYFALAVCYYQIIMKLILFSDNLWNVRLYFNWTFHNNIFIWKCIDGWILISLLILLFWLNHRGLCLVWLYLCVCGLCVVCVYRWTMVVLLSKTICRTRSTYSPIFVASLVLHRKPTETLLKIRSYKEYQSMKTLLSLSTPNPWHLFLLFLFCFCVLGFFCVCVGFFFFNG